MSEIPICPKGLSHCIECEDWNEDLGCLILLKEADDEG